ncbi:MAG: Ig-like domain-containing protein, partial [Ekhidna sp.]
NPTDSPGDIILQPNTQYYVTMPQGMFRDASNNQSASIVKGGWTFTTRSNNGVGPIITSITPGNGAADVALDEQVTVNFSEPITVDYSPGFSAETGSHFVGLQHVFTSADRMSIRLAHSQTDFQKGQVYSILKGANLIYDDDGNALPVITDPDYHTFTTYFPLSIDSSNPVNGATGSSTDGQYSLTFNNTLDAPSNPSAKISLYRYDNDQFVTYGSFSRSGKTLTINFGTLDAFTHYYASVQSGAITDVFNQGFSIGGKSTWHFTTGSVPVFPPTEIALSGNVLNENRNIDQQIGTFSSTDVDDVNFTYSLVAGSGDVDNSFFQITQNRLYTIAPLDYEAKAIRKIRVRTTDPDG